LIIGDSASSPKWKLFWTVIRNGSISVGLDRLSNDGPIDLKEHIEYDLPTPPAIIGPNYTPDPEIHPSCGEVTPEVIPHVGNPPVETPEISSLIKYDANNVVTFTMYGTTYTFKQLFVGEDGVRKDHMVFTGAEFKRWLQSPQEGGTPKAIMSYASGGNASYSSTRDGKAMEQMESVPDDSLVIVALSETDLYAPNHPDVVMRENTNSEPPFSSPSVVVSTSPNGMNSIRMGSRDWDCLSEYGSIPDFDYTTEERRLIEEAQEAERRKQLLSKMNQTNGSSGSAGQSDSDGYSSGVYESNDQYGSYNADGNAGSAPTTINLTHI